METSRPSQTVVVLGASPRSDRYAYRALEMLKKHGHRAIPVNPAFENVLGERCYPTISAVPQPIDTVALYLREARSTPLIGEIIAAAPGRIIMNPGAENPALAIRAEKAGIEVVENCTLVMLRTGKF